MMYFSKASTISNLITPNTFSILSIVMSKKITRIGSALIPYLLSKTKREAFGCVL